MCKPVGKLLLIPSTTNSNVYYRHGISVGIVAVTARNVFRAALGIALQIELLILPDLQYMGAGIVFCGERLPEPRSDPSP
jgi:hypothetical protein